MKTKTERKNMWYKNSNAKKVKCQTVVGLWCLFERDLKRLANCEVNAPETRAASLPGLLEQAWLCSTEHNETFFLENNNSHFKAKEIIFWFKKYIIVTIFRFYVSFETYFWLKSLLMYVYSLFQVCFFHDWMDEWIHYVDEAGAKYLI